MSRDHRKLRAFVEADALAFQAYVDTAAWPSHERFGLQSQVRRAAVSTATNIVEGSARESGREFRRFLNVAHGSSRECEYLLSFAARLGYGQTAAVALAQRYSALAGSLLALARSIEEAERRDGLGT